VDPLEAAGGRRVTLMARTEDPRTTRARAAIGARWRDDEGDEHRRRRARATPEVQDIDDDATDYDWDEVADIVCVGRGRIGVALAVAAKRAGLNFILADGPDREAADGSAGLAAALGVTDAETVEYLEALTEDLTPLQPVDPTIPVRVVDGPARPGLARDRIGTFYGAALRDWAVSCVSSPYGVLYTKASDASLSETYGSAQGPVEVTVLGAIDIDPEQPADGLEGWLSALAQEDDAEPQDEGSLQRLVFDNGVVVGAVLESPDGTRAIRARHGVMMTIRDGLTPTGRTGDQDRRIPARVALVSQPASRFGRLELLTAEPR
jgi:hypothetical protein